MSITHGIPKTEGIKYAGSKLKILPHIFEIISKLEVSSVLDGFSGTTRVSQALSKSGFRVVSNDISVWSEVFGTAYLLNKREISHYLPIIEHLNAIKGYSGWFTEHYGGVEGNNDKRPFQVKNTMKLDAVRDEIENMGLDDIETAVALTSLILAMDAVDNTLGHYVSYLSGWSKRSYNDMVLRVPMLFMNENNNKVIRGDAFDAIGLEKYDLAYFDPPYGSNNEKMPPSRVRYNAYYHIWKTIILNDKPELFGKANRREDSRDTKYSSVFEEYRKDESGNSITMGAVQRLLKETNANYILLSYSQGGQGAKENLYRIINESGELIQAMEIDYKRNVMGQMKWTNKWISDDRSCIEYLFLLKK